MKHLSFFRFAILALAAFVTFELPARADFIFSLQALPLITANPNTTGNGFDVLITNAGGSAATIAGFSFGITTTDADITFTTANISTVVDPYIFAGDSLLGPTISTTAPGQTLEANDLSASGNGTSIGAGSSIAVGRILFDVANGAAIGPAAVTFEAFPTTSLSDPNGGNVAFTTAPGTITITSTTTVPEPATGGLLACMLTGLMVVRRKRQ